MLNVVTNPDEYVLTYAVLRKAPFRKDHSALFHWLISENWHDFIREQADGSIIVREDGDIDLWRFRVVYRSVDELDGWARKYSEVMLLETNPETEFYSVNRAWDSLVSMLVDDEDEQLSDFWIACNRYSPESLGVNRVRKIQGIEGTLLFYEEFDGYLDRWSP